MLALPAARQTDEITHGLEMFGMIAGSILGAVAGVEILVAEAGAIVATDGLALLALPAALGAAGMAVSGGGLAGGQLFRGIEKVCGGPWKTGVLENGSPNVLIGRLPAARTVVDTATSCDGLYGLYHFVLAHVPIAEGAKKILINDQNAARKQMKLMCGAEIRTGFDRVLLGGPTARVLPVANDEDAFRSFLSGLFAKSFDLALVGSALLGPEAIILFLGAAGLFKVGFDLLGEVGDAMGPGWRDVLQGTVGIGLVAIPLFEGKEETFDDAQDLDETENAKYDQGAPRERPSWRQSEQDVGDVLGDEYSDQKSFKDGQEVPYGTEGSTRPDWHKPGESVEVKNYNIESEQGQNALVNNVSKQAIERAQQLPEGTTQRVFIDTRGQQVDPDVLDGLVDRISQKSNGILTPDNISFLQE